MFADEVLAPRAKSRRRDRRAQESVWRALLSPACQLNKDSSNPACDLDYVACGARSDTPLRTVMSIRTLGGPDAALIAAAVST